MAVETTFSEVPGFHIPEGFARITRNGQTDIYLIKNRMPLGSYWLSVAYAMDDFEAEKAVGYTMFVRETDGIEHLSGIKEYFIPLKPTEK